MGHHPSSCCYIETSLSKPFLDVDPVPADSVDSLTAALLYNSLLELVCWLGPGSAESLGAKCETKGEALKNADIAIQHYQVEKVDITT